MSYDVSSGAPEAAPRQRPGSVTTAGTLLFVAAGLIVIQLIVSAFILNRTLTASREAYQNIENGDTIITITRAAAIASLVINLIVAAVFVVFAVYNLRGRQGIRIATWVVGGLGVLCYGCNSAGGSLSTRLSNSSTQDSQIKTAAQHVADALPAWATTAATIVDVLLFLCLALVIILLAVPASNAYFRKPEPPLMAYPMYPPVG